MLQIKLEFVFSRLTYNLARNFFFSIHCVSNSTFLYSCANVRENTIASLKTASHHGADMVEFDVQLSKDLIPVIYHDFYVSISMKRKKQSEAMDMLEIPVKDLTLEQLHLLKVSTSHDNFSYVSNIMHFHFLHIFEEYVYMFNIYSFSNFFLIFCVTFRFIIYIYMYIIFGNYYL